MTEAVTAPTYCANHPKRETSLRCNRCEKPICPQCAVLTPTGYRCQECVRSQQRVFDTAQWFDYPVVIVVAGTLSFLGSLLATRLGFFTLFLAPGAAIVIERIVRAILRKRRSRRLFNIATVAVVVGSLPPLLFFLPLALGGLSRGGLFGLLPLVWQGAYTFLVTSAVHYRLSGIQIGR